MALYAGFQAWTDAMALFRSAASAIVRQRDSMGLLAHGPFTRRLFAFFDVMGNARITHDRDLDQITVGRRRGPHIVLRVGHREVHMGSARG